MASTLLPDTPAHALVAPKPDGGINVEVRIPTYSGGVALSLTVERDADGDWHVFLPNTDEYEVSNGVVFLGAPDIPVTANYDQTGEPA